VKKVKEFRYGIDHLTPKIALDLVSEDIKGIINEKTKETILKSFNAVQEISQGDKPIYSINTGFGSLCMTIISKEDTGKLQENLLKSHSVGVGNPVNPLIVKLMLILKVHALCKGYSGVSLGLIERILWHIEKNYLPLVPEQGSVGASGDLAPLAHLFLPLIGLGFISKDGKEYTPTIKVLGENKVSPLTLHAKEGVALINGTQFIAAHAIVISEQFANCIAHAEIIGAFTLEGYLGSPQPFQEELIRLRPHKGAIVTASRIRRLIKDSEYVESHKECGRVQDPYSIRCIPQVHGASRAALDHLNDILDCELNSVTDNPIVFNENYTLSGGNFHGQPLALPLDYVCLAASELGNISDRRTYLLLEGKWGLPAYLIEKSGLNSGFMIAQYCSAALVSENKSMCFPASADSIPTSMGQEDHVSMGAISARKALNVINNLEKILAIELLCAVQAFDFRKPLKSSNILEACHKYIRKIIPHVTEDVVLSELIEKSLNIIKNKQLIRISEGFNSL
jgi:histidine ammonia-lyase